MGTWKWEGARKGKRKEELNRKGTATGKTIRNAKGKQRHRRLYLGV